MRRTRHLTHCDYVMQIQQGMDQIIMMSGQSNFFVEKTWHNQRSDYELDLHARFNSNAMQGVELLCRMVRDGKSSSFAASSAKVYAVSESSWSETLIGTFGLTQSGQDFGLVLTQSQLGSYELSGFRTLAFEVTAQRRRRTFRKKIYVNHLGVFDSLNRLKRQVQATAILKVDE